MASIATHLAGALPLAITTEYLIFAGAGVISLIAFTGLILTPALGSYGRAWEKAAAAFLSLFVLAAMVLIGVAVGVAVVYYWKDITGVFGG